METDGGKAEGANESERIYTNGSHTLFVTNTSRFHPSPFVQIR